MRKVAIGVALLLVIALGAAIVFRRPLAEAVLRYAVGEAGFGEATLSVERVSWRDLVVTRIDAGEGLDVERLRVVYDLLELPALPVTAIELRGARIDFERLERPGGRDDGETGGIASLTFPGRVPLVELEDVHVFVPTPFGRIETSLAANYDPVGESLITFDARLEGERGRGTARGEARLEREGRVWGRVQIPSLAVADPRLTMASGSATIDFEGEIDGLSLRSLSGRLEGDLEGVRSGETVIGRVDVLAPFSVEPVANGWQASVDGARVGLPGHAFRLSNTSAVATLPAVTDVEIRVGRLEDTGKPSRFAPATVSVRVPEIGEVVDFHVEASPVRGGAKAIARGRFQTSAGTATARIEVPRTRFEPNGLQPGMLAPFLAHAENVRGAVAATIDARWDGQALSWSGTIVLDQLSFLFEGIAIDGLSASLGLDELTPPATRGVQSLEVARVASGVAVENLRLRYALAPAKGASRLEIEELGADLLGGSLALGEVTLDPRAEQNEVGLGLERLDVERLFETLGIPDVSGTGRLSGKIPVRLRADGVAIDEGRLEAEGPGVLRIRSATVARMLEGQGQSVDLLLRALRDFHYESLVLTVDKTFEGEAVVGLGLRGNNPDVLEGYPFALNVNVSGNVDRLVSSLAEILRLADRAVRATVPSR